MQNRYLKHGIMIVTAVWATAVSAFSLSFSHRGQPGPSTWINFIMQFLFVYLRVAEE